MIVAYDFDHGSLRDPAPSWLRGTAVSAKVINLFDDYMTSSNIDRATGLPAATYYNANFADPRGLMLYPGLTRRF